MSSFYWLCRADIQPSLRRMLLQQSGAGNFESTLSTLTWICCQIVTLPFRKRFMKLQISDTCSHESCLHSLHCTSVNLRISESEVIPSSRCLVCLEEKNRGVQLSADRSQGAISLVLQSLKCVEHSMQIVNVMQTIYQLWLCYMNYWGLSSLWWPHRLVFDPTAVSNSAYLPGNDEINHVCPS